jgi:hypothetical protein
MFGFIRVRKAFSGTKQDRYYIAMTRLIPDCHPEQEKAWWHRCVGRRGRLPFHLLRNFSRQVKLRGATF